MIKAILVDDEVHCLDTLSILLDEYCPQVSIAQRCSSAKEALLAIDQHQPALVFLDIEMPGMNGFEMLEQFRELPFSVVFTTSYDQYAIKAIHFSALDYLVKPISFDRFLKAALKAREYYEIREKNTAESKDSNADYFFIKADNKLMKVDYNEILYAEALQNYVVIHTTDRKYITYLTFRSVEEYLPSDKFIKTHKSYIISASKIDSIEGNDVRIGSHHVPISRNLKDEVMDRLLKGKFLKR